MYASALTGKLRESIAKTTYVLRAFGPAMGNLTDTKISEKNLTTVPKPVRNFLDVGEGDRVEWHVEDGEIVVKKAASE